MSVPAWRRLAGAVTLFLLLAPAPARAEAPAPRVLVLLVPLASPTEAPDPLVGEGLMDLLGWGMGRTFGLQLTEARAVTAALEARQTAWGAPVRPAVAAEVARGLGAGAALLGTFRLEEDRLALGATFLDLRGPGVREEAFSETAVPWAEGSRALERMVRALAKFLGVTLGPAGERRLSQAFQRPTPAAAALRRYATGRATLRAGTTEGLEQAADAFAQAGEIDPAFGLAFFRQGEAHEAASSRWRAAGAYRRAIHVDPAFAEAYKSLGDLLAKSPRRLYEQAVEAYGKAVEADPDYADAYVGLGDALSATGRFDEAVREYRRGLGIDPLNPRVHYSLARILYTEKGLYHEAVEAYQRALTLEPTFVEAHIGLGDLYEEKGLYREAIATYRQALALKPKHPGALYALALAYEKVSPKEAVARWEEYIKVASELPGEKEWIDIAEQHLKKMRQKAVEQEKRR
ncbi:MAG: tetratricopeptide repeat protein [candidate division NC10 bacterium]|nr:tetratricopeptide repeat protein [candidate division NC10 bacterium]